MRSSSLFSILLILALGACLDRINIDTGTISTFPVVIDGFISDQPGPYTILVTKAFDIESKTSIKAPISVKKLTVSDDHGTSEVLSETSQGVYNTSPSGIRGTLGRAYKIKVELLDGRVYESNPDTLLAAGKVDTVYYNFKEGQDTKGATTYGFDVFFNASAGSKRNFHFLWKFTGTYEVDTNPELHSEPCGEGTCPKPPSCSGYAVQSGSVAQVGSCTCCKCWSYLYNGEPIVSDDQFVQGGHFQRVQAIYIPLDPWIFQHKVHAQVTQLSLTEQSFAFWKGIKAQKSAGTSLFQPLTGKIISNFVQISGSEAPIEGAFFASSISTNSIFITRAAVPNTVPIPSPGIPFKDNCLHLFPGSTVNKPAYWGF